MLQSVINSELDDILILNLTKVSQLAQVLTFDLNFYFKYLTKIPLVVEMTGSALVWFSVLTQFNPQLQGLIPAMERLNTFLEDCSLDC